MPDSLGDKARLLHIVDFIEKIKEYLGEVGYDDFANNAMLKDACIRQLSIIGEASNRLSDEIKQDNQEIKWRQIIGLRNVVIHQYFGVDQQVIRDIIQEDLPDLKKRIKKILKNNY